MSTPEQDQTKKLEQAILRPPLAGKEWFKESAEIEGNSCVSAGIPEFFRETTPAAAPGPTPRSDGAVLPSLSFGDVIPLSFARTLERENAALKAELDAERALCDDHLAMLHHARGMFLMCRDHFAECDEETEGMPTWAKMCLDEILKIDHNIKTHTAARATKGGAS